MTVKKIITAVAAAGLLTLSACGSSSNALEGSSEAPAGSSGGSVIIGSADFTESQLIATIYSQALQAQGVEVTEQFNIGSREVYMAALQDGSIDLLPEYSGALLKYLNPDSEASTSEDVVTELATALPTGIEQYDASPAEDKDVLAVTEATASKYNLKTISDLKEYAPQLKLGGPPEWKKRVNGVVGLKDVYGLNFKEFVSLDAGGPLTLTALENGEIDAADVFSTDPAIEEKNLVALEDDKSLFAAENVVPLIVSAKSTDTIKSTLNKVSAALTTEDLISMNAKATGGEDLTSIAKAWIAEKVS